MVVPKKPVHPSLLGILLENAIESLIFYIAHVNTAPDHKPADKEKCQLAIGAAIEAVLPDHTRKLTPEESALFLRKILLVLADHLK